MIDSATINAPTTRQNQRIVFIANSMYNRTLSGGDVHTLYMAEGAIQAGYHVHFFTGHALKSEIEMRALPVTITLTDEKIPASCRWSSLRGQMRLFKHYVAKTRRTVARCAEIRSTDVVYINTDFWWDSLPGVRSIAQRKLMILGMDCPTFGEILLRTRPDVATVRLPSIHYWFAQNYSLRRFRRCRKKALFYVHPNQLPRLRDLGYERDELVHISNGIDVQQAELVPPQEKIFDVAWTGRVHQQKGITDLLATLTFLKKNRPRFRAVIIGNVQAALTPQIEALGLKEHVHFTGFVSEREKYRLLKSSRVFLMPSKYESWGIVIGEALACNLPVVAYELPAYRPVFGQLLRYVPPFDQNQFCQVALMTVQEAFVNNAILPAVPLSEFKLANSWQKAQAKFCRAIEELIQS